MTDTNDLPPVEDVQQAADALCTWLDANTWVDLHDDEAHMVDAIMYGARLLKWLPLDLKLALIKSWGLSADAAGPGAAPDGLAERTRERMGRLGIPHGTDDPDLLALGASPLPPDDPAGSGAAPDQGTND